MMIVRVERAKNRILVASESHLMLDGSIPGAYFRDRECVWSVPLDLTTCQLLREKFGNRLVIGPSLTIWARAEKAKRAEAEATAGAYDADLSRLPEVAPQLFKAMDTRRYQRSGVRYIADTEGRDGRKRALLADTVGLGKSAQALGAILEIGITGPFLIVCPKTAAESTWAKEIRKWLPEDEVITLPDGRAKRDEILWNLVYGPKVYDGQDAHLSARLVDEHRASQGRTWVVVHPAMVRTQTWFVCQELETDVAGEVSVCGAKTKYKVGPVPELNCGHEKRTQGPARTRVEDDHTFPQLFSIEWGAVVADESDQILIRLTGTPNLQRRGMEMLRDLVPPGGLRLAMSGTPFRSKPHQLWSTLNWLDPVRWSGKWRWIQNYWKTGGYSGYEIVQDGFMEEREALMLSELTDVMLRRTRDEVRGDLPAKSYPSNVDQDRDGLTEGIYLPMTRSQEQTYREMEKTGSATLAGGDVNPIGTLAELTRLRQFASAEWTYHGGQMVPLAKGNKYEWLVEFLTSMGLPDKPSTKIIVVSQFTKLLNAFADGVRKDLKLDTKRIGMLTGEQTSSNRTMTVDRFEDADSPLDIMFLNTKAGGSSITLDAADVMVFLDETFVADEQEQVEGRIDNRQPERRIAPRSYYYLRSAGTLEEHIAAANAEAKRLGLKILNAQQIARRAKEFVKS